MRTWARASEPGRGARLIVACAFGVALSWLGAPARAAPAPEYESSEPPAGAEVHEPPDEVRARFSEPLDASSTLTVLDECGRRLDDGRTKVFANEMSVAIVRDISGRYTVRYEAVGLGGITGSTTGDFHFVVHRGKRCDGRQGEPHHGNHDAGGGRHQGGNDHDTSSRGHRAHSGGAGMDHRAGGHDPGTARDHGAAHAARSGDTDHAGRDGARHRHDPSHEHRRSQRNAGEPGDDQVQAAPPDAGARARSPADLTAVAIALGLAGALGALGGWVLRVSAPA